MTLKARGERVPVGLDFLSGGDEASALLRSIDWSTTPLGNPARWPQSLKLTLRLLLSSAHPMGLFWGPQHIEFHNDALRRLLGKQAPPPGCRASSNWGENWSTLQPRIDSILKGGKASLHENQHIRLSRHGQQRDTWWTYSLSPVEDPGAQKGIGGVLMICNDVTEHRWTSEALYEADTEARHLKLIADHLPALVAYIDSNERYRFCNAAYERWWGMPPTEIIGRTVRETLGEELYRQRKPYLDAVARGELVRFEGPTPYVGRGVRNCEISYVPDIAPDGKVSGFYVMIHDITERKQVEEALRASEERLRIALQGSRTGVWEWNLRDHTIKWSPELFEILGVRQTPGPLPEQLYFDLVLPEDHERIVAEFWKAAEQGGKFTCEARVRRADTGELIWLNFVGTIELGADGKPLRAIGINQDITERRRAEQKLRESEERLQLALHVGQSGVWDWDLAREQAEVSDSYRDLFGFDPDEPVNYQTWLSRVHPDDRERTRLYGVEVFGSGSEWRIQYRIMHPTRGERWIGAIGRLERDAEGKPYRFIGVSVDLTEQKRTEQALRRAQERLNAALNAAQMAIWDWDPESDSVALSESISDLLGLPPGERTCTGAEGLDRLHPEDRARQRAIAEVALHEGSGWHDEFRVIRPSDGKVIWVEERAHITRDPVTGKRLVTGLVWDITKRKELEESLRIADRRKDEFLATLAHELRNPLAPIRNAVHLLRLTNPTDPQVRTARDIIGRQVQHMVRLVDDLLEVSRITLGQVNLRHDRISLRSVLNDALEASRPAIEAAAHGLVVQLPAEALQIEGDTTRLSQVFQNLLNNAAKYTPHGGQITLKAGRQGSEAVVCVRDTGIGIPKELQSRIFDLFTRAHPSENIKSSGLGIGLALARQLIELHGGRIEVRSEGVGAGSEFLVYLPVIESAALPSQHSPDTSRMSTSPDKRRVLVVDDNRDAAESLAMLLEISGYEVRVAYDGMQALEELERFHPDVVLLDIGMPGLDGYEVARRMRASPRGKAVRLVALTGWGQGQDKCRAAEAGFDEHLTKPVDPALIETLLTVDRSMTH